MKHEKKEETQLQDVPTDVISSMQFAPSSNQYLAISSWDGTVRLFDIQNPSKCRQKFGFESPVLDIAFKVSRCIHGPPHNHIKHPIIPSRTPHESFPDAWTTK